MQRASTPALAGLLQEAIDRGQVVVIRSLTPLHVSPLVATCSLRFGLTHAESRALVQLLEHEHVSKQALHAAISPDGDMKLKTLDVVVCHLRKKLKPHGIAITTIWGQGYALDREARDKIKQITGHDAGLIPTAPTKPAVDQQELFAGKD
jgi:DNA-binding response OmpR family regulator